MKNLSINTIFFLVLTIMFQPGTLYSQEGIQKSDSDEIREIVSTFYDWYINAVINQKINELRPVFSERNDGLTTLDYSKYIGNLRIHSFDESLISKEIQSYQYCINELEKIKYSVFKSEFKDLDDFEKIKCDFTNYKRWTGGMDPVKDFRIKSININKKNEVEVITEFCYYIPPKKEKIFSKGKILILKKKDDSWKIFNIE